MEKEENMEQKQKGKENIREETDGKRNDKKHTQQKGRKVRNKCYSKMTERRTSFTIFNLIAYLYHMIHLHSTCYKEGNDRNFLLFYISTDYKLAVNWSHLETKTWQICSEV